MDTFQVSIQLLREEIWEARLQREREISETKERNVEDFQIEEEILREKEKYSERGESETETYFEFIHLITLTKDYNPI